MWTFVILAVMLVVGFCCANAYLKSNKTKIIENVDFLNNGSVYFDEVHLSFWDDFPKASIVLSNVHLRDSMFHVHRLPLLEVGELRARLVTAGWRDLDFEINGLTLKEGTINLHTYADGYDILNSILSKPEKDSTAIDPSWLDSQLDHWMSDLQIKSNTLDIDLENVRIRKVDESNNEAYITQVNTLTAALELDGKDYNLNVDMDVHIDEITFNQDNGSYLADCDLSGSFSLIKKDDQHTVDPFDLSINEEVFTVDAIIQKGHVVPSVINVRSQHTNLAKTLPILPSKIRKDILPYKIKKDFPSKTKIVLEQGQRALVEVLFELEDANIEIDGIRAQDATLKGRFVNRKYDDRRARTEGRGNIRLILDEVSVRQGEIALETDQVFIESNPRDKASVRSMATVSGPAPTISEFYDSDKFFFKDGRFELTAEVIGPLNNLGQLILESEAELSLLDIDVLYRPADVSIPIASLELVKASGNAEFSILTSTLSKAYDYQMDGGLKNLAGLLVDFSEVSTVSNVHLFAKRLGWSDYIELFSRPEYNGLNNKKDERASKRSMKATLRGIHDKIRPTVTIAIDTFEYWDKVDMYNLTTGVHFENSNTLILDNTRFFFDQGKIELNAQVDITDPNETKFKIEAAADGISLADLLPKFDYFNVKLLADQSEHSDDFDIDIQIEGQIHDVEGLNSNDIEGSISFISKNPNGIAGKIDFQPIRQGDSMVMHSVIDFSGSPVLFNDFFKNEQFFFQDRGRFDAHFDYVGDLLSFDQLIAEADIDLKINDGAVLYEEADIVFELSDVSTKLHGDTADYVLNMRSDALDRELTATGVVENVSELIYGNTGKQLKTSVDIYSPVINVDHAAFIFETPTDTITSFFVDKEVDNKTKRLVSGLFNRFDPDINVAIDSLIVTDQIRFSDFTSGLHLNDSTTLVLEQTDFIFCGGEVSAHATAYIGTNDLEPITAKITTEHIDMSQLLSNLDYLNEDRLRDAEFIDGTLTFDLDFKGALRDLKIVDVFTDAQLDFEIDGLELKGVQLMEDLGERFKREEQFYHILFAPLANTITIKESRIDLPRMEVQSTAGNVFVEGHVDNEEGSNLWITIPLSNLKKKDLLQPPSPQGYAAAKWKVFLEFYSDDAEPMDQKLRISKRKFYKKRDMLKQLKIDRRKWRKWRKAQKDALEQ